MNALRKHAYPSVVVTASTSSGRGRQSTTLTAQDRTVLHDLINAWLGKVAARLGVSVFALDVTESFT